MRGIAFTEAIVNPADLGRLAAGRASGIFQAMRGPDGERKVLDKNVFVEKVLPASVLRGLSTGGARAVPGAVPEREDRWPTLEWPRQIPIEHVPPDVHDIVDRYGQWLARTPSARSCSSTPSRGRSWSAGSGRWCGGGRR